MIYRLLAILALVALIVGVVVLSGPQRESTAPATVGPLHDPGYAARKARLIQTGPDGQPLYTLDAAQIQQQPNRARWICNRCCWGSATRAATRGPPAPSRPARPGERRGAARG